MRAVSFEADGTERSSVASGRMTEMPCAARPLTQPHPDRLAPGHPWRTEILAAHAGALAAGEPGYLDPETGLFVLTAAYLADRGTCCGRGCRHCPYLS